MNKNCGQFDDAAGDGQFDDAPECPDVFVTSHNCSQDSNLNQPLSPGHVTGKISALDHPLLNDSKILNISVQAGGGRSLSRAHHNKADCVPSYPEIDLELKPFLKAQMTHLAEHKKGATRILESEITDNDVLCGRGGGTNRHAGNKYFRTIVNHVRPKYVLAQKLQKSSIARAIVVAVQSRGGRFVKKDESTVDKWDVISEKQAILKTSQALREGLAKQKRDALRVSMKNGTPKISLSNQAFNARYCSYAPNPLRPVSDIPAPFAMLDSPPNTSR
eukprot:CAMPEP_0185730780 /NCGR_PEP_ID=MMETSP1171-20130828/11009_1 /TAXON_ID=374046 /ORGANISM="Helicotheca tamensis, Strain CCMP826" /LENGTH=274 /DNA_ID=CAMNT_0028399909 /DNA_START=140 /DNA_END=964 /DNA_ORIENTATION=-